MTPHLRNDPRDFSPRMALAAAFVLLLCGALEMQADDWPQWRGPDRDGFWRETGILETIPTSGLQIRWRAKVGNGKDKLLCLGAWSRGSRMLKLDPAKPEASVLWATTAKPTTTLSTPILQDDHYFYAILGNGSLACLEVATGKEVWTTREPTSGSYGNAHLTPNGDRVFLFNHTGHLILARLSPAGYSELGRCLLVEPTAGFRAQGPITWAHPAYANRHVFARNDRELGCASLAADPGIQPTQPPQTSNARLLTYFDKDAALGLAFSPDGRTLAAGTWQGLVKVIDMSTGKDLPAPSPHNDWVCSVAFSPDGNLLVSAGGSEFKPERSGGKTTGQVKLWDVSACVRRVRRGRTTGSCSGTNHWPARVFVVVGPQEAAPGQTIGLKW